MSSKDVENTARKVRQAGVVLNGMLCFALVVSSGIYLGNMNEVLEKTIFDAQCVLNVLPAPSDNPSELECADLSEWKSLSVLGIVRGALFILQILLHLICSHLVRSRSSFKSITFGEILANLVTLGLSLILCIIPLYLGIKLVDTSAIYSTLEILKGPAITIFVLSLLEIIGFFLHSLGLFLVVYKTKSWDTFTEWLCSRNGGKKSAKKENNLEEEKMVQPIEKA